MDIYHYFLLSADDWEAVYDQEGQLIEQGHRVMRLSPAMENRIGVVTVDMTQFGTYIEEHLSVVGQFENTLSAALDALLAHEPEEQLTRRLQDPRNGKLCDLILWHGSAKMKAMLFKGQA